MAAARQEIDLAYRLLDLDLVDSEDRRCGKVDDLEFAGGAGEPTYVSALRSGPGALPARFVRRLRPAARRVFGKAFTRVPSELVQDVDSTVKLAKTAKEMNLGRGDRWLASLFGAAGND